jgi:hypothetical protein
MKGNKYRTLYRRNEENGRIIIDIALDDYHEFFHEWDNSVFKKRDPHPELAEFLDLCSEDIPLRKDLEIVFSLSAPQPNPEKEEQIRVSYLNYYNSLHRLETRKTKKLLRISAIMLVISLTLLFAYGLFSDYRASSLLSKVLFESILIGGWVFAWEAVHTLFLDIFAPFHRFREIKRFLRAELKFKYSMNNQIIS